MRSVSALRSVACACQAAPTAHPQDGSELLLPCRRAGARMRGRRTHLALGMCCSYDSLSSSIRMRCTPTAIRRPAAATAWV
jgi:hypothetical protein